MNQKKLGHYSLQLDFELNGTCNYRFNSCTYNIEGSKGQKGQIKSQDFENKVREGVNKGLRAL